MIGNDLGSSPLDLCGVSIDAGYAKADPEWARTTLPRLARDHILRSRFDTQAASRWAL